MKLLSVDCPAMPAVRSVLPHDTVAGMRTGEVSP
jgi:hypothetical protein